MGRLFSSVLAVALTVPFIAVAANFPPKFNVAPGCKAAAAINQSMGLSVAQNYQSCMDDEESARQQLLQSWSSFSAQDQVRCVGQTQINGMPSYVEVLGCLQVTAKSPAQPAEKKRTLDTNTDVKTGEKITEKTHHTASEKLNDDLNSTALRADLANSAGRIVELERENAALKETAAALKTSLGTSSETITQLLKKNSDADRALKTATQERLTAENQLHDLENARPAGTAEADDGGRYWQVLAYAACGGLIVALIVNVSFLWIRRKRANRAANSAAKSDPRRLGLKAGESTASTDTAIELGHAPIAIRAAAAAPRSAVGFRA